MAEELDKEYPETVPINPSQYELKIADLHILRIFSGYNLGEGKNKRIRIMSWLSWGAGKSDVLGKVRIEKSSLKPF